MGKDYEKEAIALVQNEKRNYETASAEIRKAIKKARQNYACKFLQPFTATGRKKIFIPMTRWEVDTVVPKIFVNDKAITVLPQNEESLRSSFIADKTLKYQVKQTRFPTSFRNSTYDLGIDGTIVYAIFWDFERTVTEEAPKGIKDRIKKFMGKKPEQTVSILKDKIGFKQVDVLNCFIDPTAESIQEAQSFIFKSTMPLESFKRNKLFDMNVDKVKGDSVEPYSTYDDTSVRNYEIGQQTILHEQPITSVYERWGRFPLAWISKNEKDENTYINGVIAIAGLGMETAQVVRMSKSPYDHGYKPFEECWYQKKQGRWYGIGAGEKLIDLQEYMNKTVNRQAENEDVLHSGLFKKKRNSGVSVKSIVSTPGGVIEVDDMKDLEQLQVQDVSQLSNNTIQKIQGFVERINGANEISTGSSADRSATTSLIKDRNADTRFAAVRGYINDFLVRFFTQWLALDRQFIDREFVIRVTGEDPFDQIDDALGIPLQLRGILPKTRFIKVSPESIKGQYDIEVDIDQSLPQNKAEHGERILKGIEIGKNLGINANFQALFDAYLDDIGLSGSKYHEQPALPQAPQMGQNQPNSGPMQSEMQQFQQSAVQPLAQPQPVQPNVNQTRKILLQAQQQR